MFLYHRGWQNNLNLPLCPFFFAKEKSARCPNSLFCMAKKPGENVSCHCRAMALESHVNWGFSCGTGKQMPTKLFRKVLSKSKCWLWQLWQNNLKVCRNWNFFFCFFFIGLYYLLNNSLFCLGLHALSNYYP